jgi:anti-anti-sigma factor
VSALKVETSHREGMPVIHLSGYLSSESAGPLEAAFEQAGAAQVLLLVFEEKCFINSAGFAVLFDLILPFKEQGKQVRVVHPSRHFRKVFDMVGLSQAVEVCETEAQALAAW